MRAPHWIARIAAGAVVLLAAGSAFGINRDGNTDIFWQNATSGDNAGWLMNGTNYSSSVTLAYNFEADWKMAGTGDFTKDGDVDILWRNARTGENVVWSMAGPLYQAAIAIQPMTDTNWTIVATGYFDSPADNSPDIVWRNTATGDNAIWHMNGTTFVRAVLIQEVPDLDWKVVGAGDFDRDGSSDLLWRHATTGATAVWYMQGTTVFSSAAITPGDLNWDIVATGHFNSDAKVDILWRHKTNGDTSLWLMDGTTLLSTLLLPWAGPAWRIGGVGDALASFDPGTRDSLPDIWERRFIGHLGLGESDDPDADGSRTSWTPPARPSPIGSITKACRPLRAMPLARSTRASTTTATG